MMHGKTATRHHGDLEVGQVDDLVGMSGQRRSVTAEKILVPANSDHQRAAESGSDQQVRLFRKQDRQSVGPLQLGRRPLDRGDVAAVIVAGTACGKPLQPFGDQVRDHFGVRRRAKDIALPGQFLAKHREVLDHAVMHQHHFAIAAEVRVRVLLNRRTMRGPAGMPQADRAGQRLRTMQLARRSMRPTDRHTLSPWSPMTAIPALS